MMIQSSFFFHGGHHQFLKFLVCSTTGRGFRSKAALDALIRASEEKVPNLVLYNYPSFTGAYAALFARLFHSHLNRPLLILPYSSVEPLRVEDLKLDGIETCYLLDFSGSKGFAVSLSEFIPGRVVVFDHRNYVLSNIPKAKDCPDNLTFYIDTQKSSGIAVYDYFSRKLKEAKGEKENLVTVQKGERLTMILKYLEDGDLRQWKLHDIKEFSIGFKEIRSKLNCITNPYIFDQLLEIDSSDIIAKGKSILSSHRDTVKKLLRKAFRMKLGNGFYGECLGTRADGNSHLSDEIGKELSLMSASAGLRPIGAVVFMQRNNLKMCLRSLDASTDTSEVAKAYGGGGYPSSSSFIIRMDEYNQWISVNSP